MRRGTVIRFVAASIRVVISAIGFGLCLLLLARPVAAASSWNGGGPLTMTTSPDSQSHCTATGSMTLTLSGSGSTVSGRLAFVFDSVSDGCFRSFAAGVPVAVKVSGTLNGNKLTLTDSDGDAISGTFAGNRLSLIDRLAPPPSQPGSACGQFCHTVLNGSLTGSGSLISSGGFASLGNGGGFTPPPADGYTFVAANAAFYALLSLMVVAASVPPRLPAAARGFVGAGTLRFGTRRWGTVHQPPPQVGPATPPPPPGAPPPFIGTLPSEQGTPITGNWVPPPPSPPPIWVKVISSFYSINGVPLNPNWGDRAWVRPDPNDGRRRYWDQHTGEYYNAWPP